jgi:hypothetical protein
MFYCLGKRWLLVFDNADELNDIIPYCPQNLQEPGCILITSQRSQFVRITDGPYKTIQVQEFSQDLGAHALFKYLERAPDRPEEFGAAKKISSVIGGLPLAIATVAGYISQSRSSLDDFLESFNQSSKFWSSGRLATLGIYERTLSTVFQIALDDLNQDSQKLLEILAFLNPDEVPEEMLRMDKPPHRLQFLSKVDKAG